MDCTFYRIRAVTGQRVPLTRFNGSEKIVGQNGKEFGRRDWIRTNDPHHVKVVL
ncbi:hypothetical protein CARN8_110005 [mine drainage metagenome]|uniref:Uncharacterized protein n=1 Tax=mine drainage metagenome TaxID=410659 RepID=A0A3P3ZLB1_9ZZZZ